jgi:hypothetical protein
MEGHYKQIQNSKFKSQKRDNEDSFHCGRTRSFRDEERPKNVRGNPWESVVGLYFC